MPYKFLFSILQIVVPFLIKSGVEVTSESIRLRGQIAYVESIRIARYAVICLMICIISFVVLLTALIALIYGIIVLVPMERETIAWVMLGGGSVVVIAFAITIYFLLSERRWIEVFQLDKLVKR